MHSLNILISFPISLTIWDVRDDHMLFVFSPGTVKSMTERSKSRLKFLREKFWYKLLSYELVNPTIKISLFEGASFKARILKKTMWKFTTWICVGRVWLISWLIDAIAMNTQDSPLWRLCVFLCREHKYISRLLKNSGTIYKNTYKHRSMHARMCMHIYVYICI